MKRGVILEKHIVKGVFSRLGSSALSSAKM